MLTAFLDVVGSANFINEITKERSVTSRYHGSKMFWITTIQSLSNDDGNGNENGKKATSLDWQNNMPARASRFFVHFLAVVARLRRETS